MKYFIDTSIIIDFLNKDKKAIKTITDIAEDENSIIHINRLVMLESLRTIDFKNTKIYKKSEEILKNFTSIEIKPQTYKDTILFSRYCHSRGIKLNGNCDAIDFLHFITAKNNNLEIVTNDKGFDRLEKVHQEFLKEKAKI